MTADSIVQATIAEAKQAALAVLRHNARGNYAGLPRTAGWGYPEPYTRDLMICALGTLVAGDEELVDSLRRTLVALAANQTLRGHITSLAHEPTDRGASDTTPLFLLALALYRQVMGEPDFLEEAALKALTWMEYQSPSDEVLVAQQPTSDWRDEQWVLGHGLYVNTVVYAYLRLLGHRERAQHLRELMNRLCVRGKLDGRIIHEGLRLSDKPYYAVWSYKVLHDDRFDLLGNSLAILFGACSCDDAARTVSWVEEQCQGLRQRGDLAGELPPCLIPFIQPTDSDWHPRYDIYGQPGHYHNGGTWPFISAFYVAALTAACLHDLAARKLLALTEAVRPRREADVAWGFNEWLLAQDGTPQGQDWQSWSAAMYLYAAACVEQRRTPFFEEMRGEEDRSQ